MTLAQQHIEKEHYSEAEYFESDHGAITSNAARALGNVLVPRGCRVYFSGVQVHTGDGINTFPDVSVFCGTHHDYAGRDDAVLNPLLIIEVLSPSTEAYDRGDKFDHYQTIETLTDCLPGEQDQARMISYTRRADYWKMRTVTGLTGSVFLPSVDVTLALADVYALVEFEAEA